MFRHSGVPIANYLRALAAFLLIILCAPAASAAAPIAVLTIDGAIGPANADYVVLGIARAALEAIVGDARA